MTSEDALQEVASQMKSKLNLTEDEVRSLIACELVDTLDVIVTVCTNLTLTLFCNVPDQESCAEP